MILAEFRNKAKQLDRTIVLPEGDDSRTIEAAAQILKQGIARLIILGSNATKITADLKSEGFQLPSDKCTVSQPAEDPRWQGFSDKYYEMRKNKGTTLEEAREAMKDPLFFGAMLVRENCADGCVMGAANTTAAVLRAGLRVIGVKKDIRTVSSCFIMASSKKDFGNQGTLLFADCAVNPDPTAEMLADIAISTAESCRQFLGKPRIAMLSFSTKGSAVSPSTLKVAEATKIVKEKMPELCIDGEMQLDAAIIPAVGERKAPGSEVAGKANVLIFPNLDAANIGYKLVERFVDAEAIGPIVQGFAKPVNDLSRGCSAKDIVNTVAITCVQAG